MHAAPGRQRLVKRCVLMLALQVWGSRGVPGQVPCTSWVWHLQRANVGKELLASAETLCVTSTVQLAQFRLNVPEICSTSRV